MAETVQLFEPCLIDSFFPQNGEAMVKVLKRVGVGGDCHVGQRTPSSQ